MANIKQLEAKEKKIKKMLNKAKDIADRQPIENTKFGDVWESYDVPPYTFTLAAYLKFGEDVYHDLTEEPSNGRVRGKIEKGINKAIAGLCAGAMVAIVVPFTAIVETPMSLPGVLFIGGETIVNNKYNKNIQKAKARIPELEKQLNEVQKEINKQKQQQSGLEL